MGAPQLFANVGSMQWIPAQGRDDMKKQGRDDRKKQRGMTGKAGPR